MKIVVLDGHTLNPGDNAWDQIARLGELVVHDRTPPELVVPRAREAEIVLTNKTPLNRAALRQLPKMRYVGVLATGYNIVDAEAAAEMGVLLTNVPEYGTDSVAQFTFALLLELCHHIGLHDEAVKRGEWSTSPDWCFWKTPLIELAGKMMGIVGYGRIGRRVGQIAEAFGMKVIQARRGQMSEAAEAADVLSLHCPLTPETAGMINRNLLEQMKPTAMLINTARGGLIVEQDLANSLNEGRLAGAAVDVASIEPIRPDNPLLSTRNCIITPHIAWATREARRRLIHAAAGNIAAFLAGRPVNVVNTPVRG